MTVPAGSSRPKRDSRHSGQTRTALYRFYDENAQLLYVGITKRLQIRWREHARDYATTWWPLVRSNSVHWYPNRTEAGRAERQAIRDENPLYNVMHTVRNRVAVGTRSSRDSFTEQRGDSLLKALQANFADRPFTTLDAIALGGASPSGVQKNMNALVIRGLVMIVGARHSVTSGLPRRSSALYMLPINEWVDRETGLPLAPERVPTDTPEVPTKRLPVPKQRSAPVPRNLESAPSRSEKEPNGALPPYVTFTSGAALLEELGLVASITREGVRFISRSADWPFGPGRKHEYGKAGRTQTMDTQAFLDYFRTGPRRGGIGRQGSHPAGSKSQERAE
ncbi:GIY-YIG nuclease family protein [Streptomyces sp. NPDC001288]